MIIDEDDWFSDDDEWFDGKTPEEKNALREIRQIYERYDTENLAHYKHYEIAEAIYGWESEIWKIPLKETFPSEQDDFLHISLDQERIFGSILATDQTAEEKIKTCFMMISDIENVIVKCLISGAYTETKAIGLRGLLLSNFARQAFFYREYKTAYWKNRVAVDFYQRLWKPYEIYMVAHGHWQKEKEEETPLTRMLNRNRPNKTGCLFPIVIGCLIVAAVSFV